jgi:hypothetical protein
MKYGYIAFVSYYQYIEDSVTAQYKSDTLTWILPIW